MEKIKTPFLILTQEIFSFWRYKTQEDRIARNIWVGLVLSLLVISTLTILIEKQI